MQSLKNLIWALLAMLCWAPAWAQTEDDLLCAEKERLIHRIHGRANSGTAHGYDIDYYRCHWQVNPKNGPYLKGKVMARFEVLQVTDSIGLDFVASMQIDSIKRGNQHIPYERNGDAVYVKKPGSWAIGWDSVEVFYQGNPSNNGGFGSYAWDQHMTGPVIHTLSQPYGAKFWWPCKQTLHDKIDSIDIYIYTDTGMKAGSNGLLVEQWVQSDTQAVYHWKHRYPVATYLVAMAVSNYAEYTQYAHWSTSKDSMPMLNYVFPQFRTQSEIETRECLYMLRIFDSLFTEYPFKKEKYGHAQFTWGGGMEHQTMSFMVNFSFDLLAHELAHMWFGDMVTCGSWQDLWLNEGFATYLNGIALENMRGTEAFQLHMRGLRFQICSKDGGSVFPKDTLNVNSLFDGRLTYRKGAWVLHMLRDQLGDEAFFAACRDYLQAPDNAYGFGYTPEFQAALERASGRNLDTFIQTWYYGEGFPYLDIAWKQRGRRMSVEVKQTPAHASVPLFYIPVPLKFMGQGRDTLIRVYPYELTESFVLDLPFAVDSVAFDPEIRVLAKAKVGGVNLDALQAEPFAVLPNPAQDIAALVSKSGQLMDVQVYDALGQLVWQAETAELGSVQVDIPVKNWSAGTYLIRASDENFVSCTKLIKRP
ncbi:MAG: M1 family aminopeptidase [Bacteroidetes bacterium]|nr:M1 family aminopeptidase [Bacteroidota bacterium]MDA0943559.1 M1 family aminopeptidase [Bacteroidota bacterium]MDA1111820.1 M1 family aminopeptidase [Bacteroidota bacterium]